MHVWTINVHLKELVPHAQESFVPSAARLRHDVVQDRIAHPPWRCDHDSAKRGTGVGDVSEEGCVEGRVELGESFLMCGGASCNLASYGDLEALQDDRHMFRQEAKYRSACVGAVNYYAPRCAGEKSY